MAYQNGKLEIEGSLLEFQRKKLRLGNCWQEKKLIVSGHVLRVRKTKAENNAENDVKIIDLRDAEICDAFIQGSSKTHVFKIFHADQIYCFACNSAEECSKWTRTLSSVKEYWAKKAAGSYLMMDTPATDFENEYGNILASRGKRKEFTLTLTMRDGSQEIVTVDKSVNFNGILLALSEKKNCPDCKTCKSRHHKAKLYAVNSHGIIVAISREEDVYPYYKARCRFFLAENRNHRLLVVHFNRDCFLACLVDYKITTQQILSSPLYADKVKEMGTRNAGLFYEATNELSSFEECDIPLTRFYDDQGNPRQPIGIFFIQNKMFRRRLSEIDDNEIKRKVLLINERRRREEEDMAKSIIKHELHSKKRAVGDDAVCDIMNAYDAIKTERGQIKYRYVTLSSGQVIMEPYDSDDGEEEEIDTRLVKSINEESVVYDSDAIDFYDSEEECQIDEKYQNKPRSTDEEYTELASGEGSGKTDKEMTQTSCNAKNIHIEAFHEQDCELAEDLNSANNSVPSAQALHETLSNADIANQISPAIFSDTDIGNQISTATSSDTDIGNQITTKTFSETYIGNQISPATFSDTDIGNQISPVTYSDTDIGNQISTTTYPETDIENQISPATYPETGNQISTATFSDTDIGKQISPATFSDSDIGYSFSKAMQVVYENDSRSELSSERVKHMKYMTNDNYENSNNPNKDILNDEANEALEKQNSGTTRQKCSMAVTQKLESNSITNKPIDSNECIKSSEIQSLSDISTNDSQRNDTIHVTDDCNHADVINYPEEENMNIFSENTSNEGNHPKKIVSELSGKSKLTEELIFDLREPTENGQLNDKCCTPDNLTEHSNHRKDPTFVKIGEVSGIGDEVTKQPTDSNDIHKAITGAFTCNRNIADCDITGKAKNEKLTNERNVINANHSMSTNQYSDIANEFKNLQELDESTPKMNISNQNTNPDSLEKLYDGYTNISDAGQKEGDIDSTKIETDDMGNTTTASLSIERLHEIGDELRYPYPLANLKSRYMGSSTNGGNRDTFTQQSLKTNTNLSIRLDLSEIHKKENEKGTCSRIDDENLSGTPSTPADQRLNKCRETSSKIAACNICASMRNKSKPLSVTTKEMMEWIICQLHDHNICHYICLLGTHLRYLEGVWELTDQSEIDRVTKYDDFLNRYKRYNIGNGYVCIWIPAKNRHRSRWLVKRLESMPNSTILPKVKKTDDTENTLTPHPSLLEADSVYYRYPALSDTSLEDSFEFDRPITHSVIQKYAETGRKMFESVKNGIDTKLTFVNNFTVSKGLDRTFNEGFLPEELLTFQSIYTKPLQTVVVDITSRFQGLSAREQRALGDDGTNPSIGWLIRNDLCTALAKLLHVGLTNGNDLIRSIFFKLKRTTLWSLVKEMSLSYGKGEIAVLVNKIEVSRWLVNDDIKFRFFLCDLLNNSKVDGSEKLLISWFQMFPFSNRIPKFYVNDSFWRMNNAEHFKLLFEEIILSLKLLNGIPFSLHEEFEMKQIEVENKRKAAFKNENHFPKHDSNRYVKPGGVICMLE